MLKRTLSPEQEQQVASEYRKGFGLVVLAEWYGVSQSTVRNALKRLDVPRRSRGRPGLDRAKIVAEYQYGHSPQMIADSYGVGAATIRKHLREAGCDSSYQPKSPLPENQIVSRYKAGQSLRKIATSYGVSVERVRTLLKGNGVSIQRPGRKPGSIPSNKKDLPEMETVSLYESGQSLRMIGISHGVSSETIRTVLKKNGIERRKHGLNKESYSNA